MSANLSCREHKEHTVFRKFLRSVPGLESHLMSFSEEEVILIADLVRLF